jgi:hypothetical protein
MSRAGPRQSWLVGLGLGVPTGFLLLEFPIAGVLIFAAAGTVLAIKGQAMAGIGGLLVGVGLTWIVAFGRVKLTCHPDSCTAPTIDAYLAVSFAILAFGTVASAVSAVSAVRARRA